jgi:hypothetical protein
MTYLKTIVLIIYLFGSGLKATAEPLNDSSREIDHLFVYLKNSGCQFSRNGIWYQAKDAAAHLELKYKYLSEKGPITSTESFIRQAASESSVTGIPYLVKCKSDDPIESAVWFNDEVIKYRKSLNNPFVPLTQ